MPAQTPHSTSRVTAPFFSPNAPTPHPQRCEYTSKRCENARALKPNGERHRLCDHHRRLANNNQRRWQNRKKLQQRAEQSQISALLELRHAAQPSDHPLAHPATHSSHASAHHGDALTERQHTVQAPARQDDVLAMRVRSPVQQPYHSGSPLPPLEQRPRVFFRPQEPTLVLPRLRNHHVLSHALSLPVAIPHSASETREFGGVPRGSFENRFSARPVLFERSTSAPVERAWWPPHGGSDHQRPHEVPGVYGSRARAVTSREY